MQLAWSMRVILLDWLVQVHAHFRLLPETLFLCVNIINRFLSARVVSLTKLQLVGIACLFVVSKVEETRMSHLPFCTSFTARIPCTPDRRTLCPENYRPELKKRRKVFFWWALSRVVSLLFSHVKLMSIFLTSETVQSRLSTEGF